MSLRSEVRWRRQPSRILPTCGVVLNAPHGSLLKEDSSKASDRHVFISMHQSRATGDLRSACTLRTTNSDACRRRREFEAPSHKPNFPNITRDTTQNHTQLNTCGLQ